MSTDDGAGPAGQSAALRTVAIVVPCYESGPTLVEAIDSALAQTYPSVEVTVVDDGSRDRETLRVLDELDPRVRVIRQENAGPAAARNTAIASTDAEFVLPLDADDRLAPRAAEIGARHLTDDADAGIVSGSVRLFGDQEGIRRCEFTGIDSMLLGTKIPMCSTFRRRDWAEVGGYPTEIHRGEDWAFWMRILRLGRSVTVVEDVCYEYRIWGRQESALVDPVASAEGSNFVMLENRDLYAQHADWLIDELAGQRLMLAQFRKTYGRQERLRDSLRRRLRR